MWGFYRINMNSSNHKHMLVHVHVWITYSRQNTLPSTGNTATREDLVIVQSRGIEQLNTKITSDPSSGVVCY